MANSILTLTDRLASLPWLDAVASRLHQVWEPLLGADAPATLKDALYGTWLGHPLHPAMTDVPVGCWTSSLILDAAGMERGADITLKVGTLGAVGAAITGAAQWQDLQEMDEPRRLGALHATLNIVATGLYATSWVLRDRGARGAGIAVSTTGYALAATSALLGGDLAYRLGIGVSRVAFDEPQPDWRDAISTAEVKDGVPARVEVDGESLLVLKDGDSVYVTSATCTHVGGPLHEGEVSDGCVTCPWHGSEFDLRDGHVVHGPATSPVHAYETRVVDGQIQVRPLAAA